MCSIGQWAEELHKIMTRIATLAANEHLLGILTRTQNQVQDLQTQVATGKRAQTYAGIAQDTRELLGLERSRQVLERFDRNNDLMKTRLDATTTAIDGIAGTVRQLRDQLLALNSGVGAQDAQWITDPELGQRLEEHSERRIQRDAEHGC